MDESRSAWTISVGNMWSMNQTVEEYCETQDGE